MLDRIIKRNLRILSLNQDWMEDLKYFFKWNSLGWHWLIKLYRFQVYNSMIHHLYLCCVFTTKVKSPSTTIYLTPFSTCTHPLPSGNTKLLSCLLVCLVYLFVAFIFISHIHKILYGSWFFPSESVIRNNELLSFGTMWMDLENIMLREWVRWKKKVFIGKEEKKTFSLYFCKCISNYVEAERLSEIHIQISTTHIILDWEVCLIL